MREAMREACRGCLELGVLARRAWRGLATRRARPFAATAPAGLITPRPSSAAELGSADARIAPSRVRSSGAEDASRSGYVDAGDPPDGGLEASRRRRARGRASPSTRAAVDRIAVVSDVARSVSRSLRRARACSRGTRCDRASGAGPGEDVGRDVDASEASGVPGTRRIVCTTRRYRIVRAAPQAGDRPWSAWTLVANSSSGAHARAKLGPTHRCLSRTAAIYGVDDRPLVRGRGAAFDVSASVKVAAVGGDRADCSRRERERGGVRSAAQHADPVHALRVLRPLDPGLAEYRGAASNRRRGRLVHEIVREAPEPGRSLQPRDAQAIAR